MGKFRLTNPIRFTGSSTPNLNAFLFSNQTGMIPTSVTVFIGAATTVTSMNQGSSTAPTGRASAQTTGSCGGLILNPPCPTIAVGQATYTSCGAVVVTSAPVNTYDSVKWTTNGAGSFDTPLSTTATYLPTNQEIEAYQENARRVSDCGSGIDTVRSAAIDVGAFKVKLLLFAPVPEDLNTIAPA